MHESQARDFGHEFAAFVEDVDVQLRFRRVGPAGPQPRMTPNLAANAAGAPQMTDSHRQIQPVPSIRRKRTNAHLQARLEECRMECCVSVFASRGMTQCDRGQSFPIAPPKSFDTLEA